MKKWYLSKTLIFNVLSFGLLVVEKISGTQYLDSATAATVIALGNFVLRFFTTKPVTK